MIDNFNMSKWVQDLHLKESQIREFDNDDVDRIMNSLESTVNEMMHSLEYIEITLRTEPELDFKVRDTEMLLRHLKHQLSVLKEKLSL